MTGPSAVDLTTTLRDAAGPTNDRDSGLRTLSSRQSVPRVRLVKPADSGFILIAAEVDRRPPFLGASLLKRRLIDDCKRSNNLDEVVGVLSAVVFRAILVPPGGKSPYILRRRQPFHRARFDVAILIETDSVARAEEISEHPVYCELERRIRGVASHTYATTAANVKRIGPVDHSRNGVFLFNYFIADRCSQNLAVWEYSAGWFQQETGLDNSTVLQPRRGDESEYTLINHCRWDHLRNVLPSLIFKRSFHDYVLAHFDANDTAPMPILYGLA
jgi:hypothetical protein